MTRLNLSIFALLRFCVQSIWSTTPDGLNAKTQKRKNEGRSAGRPIVGRERRRIDNLRADAMCTGSRGAGFKLGCSVDHGSAVSGDLDRNRSVARLDIDVRTVKHRA